MHPSFSVAPLCTQAWEMMAAHREDLVRRAGGQPAPAPERVPRVLALLQRPRCIAALMEVSRCCPAKCISERGAASLDACGLDAVKDSISASEERAAKGMLKARGLSSKQCRERERARATQRFYPSCLRCGQALGAAHPPTHCAWAARLAEPSRSRHRALRRCRRGVRPARLRAPILIRHCPVPA